MSLHCLSFFQSQKVKIMSDSCHFHGSFMALSHTSLTWVQSAKIYWKSCPKSRCWLSICFFLPNFSFIFGNMSDSCRFHGPFMALSWRFLPSDFYCFSKQFHGTCMSDSWQIHRGFIADSSRIHRGFMPVSFSPKKSKSCQIHVAFMAVSWQFHGTFTYKPYLGTVCQNLLEKVIQKVGVGCRFGFFWPNFSFIFGNMSDSCRFHGPFMALSSF